MEANHSEWILQCELYFGYQGTDVQVGAHMVTLELQLRFPGFVKAAFLPRAKMPV